MTIPSIQFEQLSNPDEQKQLLHACETYGVFLLQLSNPSVDSVRKNLFAAANRFFAQPQSEKLGYARTESRPLGFNDQELTKQKRDWKEIFDLSPSAEGQETLGEMYWPTEPENFRAITSQWFKTAESLSQQLLKAIALGLSLEESTLSNFFEPKHTSFLRLNYYPACPQNTLKDAPLGISHHTDAGGITILCQDGIDALQIYVDDQWQTISPAPNELIVNVGDMLQVWTNDKIRAPLHRVLTHSHSERFSAAYFHNPNLTAKIEPLISTEEPRYQAFSWQDFRSARAAGDYSNIGEEIQISDFVLS